jgi:hypothetical protein
LLAHLQIADNSVMVSSKDGQTVVQVASYDMAIVDNNIVARQVSGSLPTCLWQACQLHCSCAKTVVPGEKVM